MAKRKSIFDDRPQEIQQLTFIVKQDIGQLNKQIAQLQEVSCPTSLGACLLGLQCKHRFVCSFVSASQMFGFVSTNVLQLNTVVLWFFGIFLNITKQKSVLSLSNIVLATRRKVVSYL